MDSKAFFGIFEDLIGNKAPIKVGDKVTSGLGNGSTAKGVLIAFPTQILPFCIVDGFITKFGVSKRDTKILVHSDSLKAAQ